MQIFSKYIIFSTILLSSTVNFAQSNEDKQLHFLTTTYCPLICEDNKDEGIMVDILREIYKPFKYDIKITYRPIRRAFIEYSDKKYHGFIGGNQKQLKNNLFPTYSTVPNPTVFYKSKRSKWNYTGFDSVKNVRIAAVSGFNYPNLKISNHINKKNKNVLLVESKGHLKKMITLTKNNRITAFLAGELATQYFFQNFPLSKDVVMDKKVVGLFHNFISINPNTKASKKLLSILDKRFIEIFENGKLREIYKKYGIVRELKLHKLN